MIFYHHRGMLDVTIGFRVGNVSHTINNQWETTIEAQAIVLKGKYKKQS